MYIKQWMMWLTILMLTNPFHSFAADKTFNAVAAPFPPLIGPTLENNGCYWEICTAALESQGYTVTLTFIPWARAMKEAQHGRFDGLFPTYLTQERTQWFIFSRPVKGLRTGFFKHKDRKDLVFNGDLRTMTNHTIGVGRDHSTSEEFDRASYLDKYEVTNNVMSLKMLWSKRLDLIVGDETVELYHLKNINKDPHFNGIQEDIVFMEPPLQERALYMAISKNAADSAQKLEDFNRGIQYLIDSGEYQEILERHAVAPH